MSSKHQISEGYEHTGFVNEVVVRCTCSEQVLGQFTTWPNDVVKGDLLMKHIEEINAAASDPDDAPGSADLSGSAVVTAEGEVTT